MYNKLEFEKNYHFFFWVFDGDLDLTGDFDLFGDLTGDFDLVGVFKPIGSFDFDLLCDFIFDLIGVFYFNTDDRCSALVWIFIIFRWFCSISAAFFMAAIFKF